MLYENETHDEERSFYGVKNAIIKNCTIDGPADGESAFKECRDICAIPFFYQQFGSDLFSFFYRYTAVIRRRIGSAHSIPLGTNHRKLHGNFSTFYGAPMWAMRPSASAM